MPLSPVVVVAELKSVEITHVGEVVPEKEIVVVANDPADPFGERMTGGIGVVSTCTRTLSVAEVLPPSSAAKTSTVVALPEQETRKRPRAVRYDHCRRSCCALVHIGDKDCSAFFSGTEKRDCCACKHV